MAGTNRGDEIQGSLAPPGDEQARHSSFPEIEEPITRSAFPPSTGFATIGISHILSARRHPA